MRSNNYANEAGSVGRGRHLVVRSPVLCLSLLLALAATAQPTRAGSTFDVPASLRHEVSFWQDVFTVYSREQVAVHDMERLDRVYSILDFHNLQDAGLTDNQIFLQKKRVKEAEVKRIRAILRHLHRGTARTQEEARIRALFDGDSSPNRFLRAADAGRVRTQTGLREKFAAAITIGHGYFPAMEAIFRRERVPTEITRLPLVESSFNLHAYSKVGAAGLWQFMPGTARMFSLQMNDAIDQRLDPLSATRAAARFLRQSYDRLGTWPLAIMSYNHGPGGIARAKKTLGTSDESVIIRKYRGRRFGFASRNFYPEFLAAMHAEKSYVDHFGPLPVHRPLNTDVVKLPHYVPAGSVLRCAGTSREEFGDLNPSLLGPVYDGKLRIPREYDLHLPAKSGERFQQCYASLPASQKFAKQKRHFVLHRVRAGQTLGQIARHYGRSVDEIRRRNGLRNKNLIRKGQVLRIPTG